MLVCVCSDAPRLWGPAHDDISTHDLENNDTRFPMHADYTSRPENFACLVACRKAVAEALGVAEHGLELSMGMSADFEQAIAAGATNVRVGSTIFGARNYAAR